MTNANTKTLIELPAGAGGQSRTQTQLSPTNGQGSTDQSNVVEDLRRRNAELTRANAELTEALASRDAFLAVAAHELRNPMTPIVGRVHLLRRMIRKDEVRPETIEQGLAQLEWLIDQFVKRATILLDVSRISSGKLRLESAPVEVCALVRQVVQSFAPLLDHAAAPLNVTLPEEDIVGNFDRLALEQILDNLVSNAIKYGAGQSISVAVTNEAEVGLVLIRVRDGGPGISIENQARIFGQFERAVQAGDHSAGFGVGLWIVRQLAEAMGGTIELDSALGAGSTFLVTLPLRTDKDQE